MCDVAKSQAWHARSDSAASADRRVDCAPIAVRKSCVGNHLSIIHHQSSLISDRAFTLIELLVVIAIIALLMSILMPTLQRVRRQAKAVACRASLRQWGPVLDMYANDDPQMLRERWWPEILVRETSSIAEITRKITVCPATTTRHKGSLGQL